MSEVLLDRLVTQLTELVPVLRALGPSSTGQGEKVEKASVAFDRSSTRIVAAIGKLAAQLDKSTRGKKAEERSLAEFMKEVERATDITERSAAEQAAAAAEVEKAFDELAAASRGTVKQTREETKAKDREASKKRLNAFREERDSRSYAAIQAEEEARLLGSKHFIRDALEKVAGENLNLQRGLKYTSDVVGGLGDAAKSTISTLSDLGTNGFNSFNQLNGVVDSVTGAITKMAGSLPIVGAAMTAVAEATKFALTQIQQVADNFRELSEVGALTASGMSGLKQNLIDSGLTQQGLTNIIKQNSTAFSMLGGTVGDGSVTFSKFVGKLTKDTTGAGLQLRNLGLSADDIGESAAAFVELQGRLGTTQRMKGDQLTEGTVRYIRELDIISKITGQSRKELQASQQKAMGEQRFRAKLEQMRRSGDEKQIEAANKALSFSAALEKTAPELAQGFRDVFAGGGAAATDAAVQAVNATDGAIVGIVQQLARGGDIGDALGQLQTALGKTTDRMNTTAQFGDLSEFLGNYAQLLDVTKLSAGDLKTATQSAKETQDKQAAGQDKYTNKVVEAQQQLELAAKGVQDFGFKLAENAIPAVGKFAEVLKDITDTINEELGVKTEAADPGPLITTDNNSLAARAGRAVRGMFGKSSTATPASSQNTPGQPLLSPEENISAPASAPAPAPAPASAPASAPGARAIPSGPSGAEDPTKVAAIKPEDVLKFTARSGSASAFAALDSGLQKAVLAAASDYNAATGNKIIINSAKRELADQERLYAAWVARGKTGMPVADPKGKPSKHILGHAVDIQNYTDPAAVAAMNRQGLKQTVPKDPVHFSFAKGGIASGPKSGYKAMLHGTEAVVPLPDGKKIPVNMQESSNGNMSKQMDMMSAQLMRLDEMVSLMRRQVGVSDKMLRVSQS
jgi:hypothetical protein